MAQLSYSINTLAAFLGMKADNQEVVDVRTGLNSVAAAIYGTLQVLGLNDGEVKPPAALADISFEKAVGVVLSEQSLEQPYQPSPNAIPALPQYPQGFAVNLLAKGRVWVYAEDVVVAGQDVYVRYAAGMSASGVAAPNTGTFMGAAVANQSAMLPNAKWITSTTSAGQLAIVQIGL